MIWNWADAVLIILIISGLAAGYRRGITQIVSGWLGLIIGLMGAFIFFKPLKAQLLVWLHLNQMTVGGVGKPVSAIILSALMTVVAFALILIAVNLAFKLLGRGVHNLMDTIGLAWVDGGLGAAITLIITLVVIALLLGMGMPLLQMGTTAGWDWAAAANQEIKESMLQPFFIDLYKQWGEWVKPRI